MKVKLTRTGDIVEYDASFAVRLIEQGKAVIVPKEPAKKPAKKADA